MAALKFQTGGGSISDIPGLPSVVLQRDRQVTELAGKRTEGSGVSLSVSVQHTLYLRKEVQMKDAIRRGRPQVEEKTDLRP